MVTDHAFLADWKYLAAVLDESCPSYLSAFRHGIPDAWLLHNGDD